MSEYGIINNETGEYIGDYNPKSKRNFNYRYSLFFTYNIAKHKINITSTMFIVLSMMDTNNYLIINSEKISYLAKYHSITENALRITITKMIKLNMCIRIQANNYIINPFFITKTSMNKLAKIREYYSELMFKQKSKPKRIKEPKIYYANSTHT